MFLEQHIRIISKGSGDTEVMMLKIQLCHLGYNNFKCIKIVILKCYNISQYSI